MTPSIAGTVCSLEFNRDRSNEMRACVQQLQHRAVDARSRALQASYRERSQSTTFRRFISTFASLELGPTYFTALSNPSYCDCLEKTRQAILRSQSSSVARRRPRSSNGHPRTTEI